MVGWWVGGVVGWLVGGGGLKRRTEITGMLRKKISSTHGKPVAGSMAPPGIYHSRSGRRGDVNRTANTSQDSKSYTRTPKYFNCTLGLPNILVVH